MGQEVDLSYSTYGVLSPGGLERVCFGEERGGGGGMRGVKERNSLLTIMKAWLHPLYVKLIP